MKKLSAFLTSLMALAVLLPARPALADDVDPGQISIAVGRLLEQAHYTRRKLDPDLSRLFLKNYLESIDYNHLFFTQSDVDAFNTKYGAELGDDILLGNPNAAFEIWDVYTKRVEDRVAKVKDLLKQDYTFTSDRTVEPDRTKAPWPKDDAEADQIWRNRIEGELLQEKLIEHPIEPGLKAVNRRYNQLLKNLHETTKDDVAKNFFSVLAQTYDPHSDYMSKDDLTSFNIQMQNSLVGIGAVLRSDEGYAKIMDLVEGGPAKMSGKLKVGDRISAVAQGTDEFVDVIDMKLDKVVDMIRGKKGTTVRLKVISAHTSDTKIVEIVRDQVKLKEQDAKAELIEMPDSNGQPRRLGWIRLPAFYADMEHPGPDAKSTTKDVLALLNRLKQENISGLVIDLRNNGGGSLEEAVNLTGLFTPKGPVVQTKNSNGDIHVDKSHYPEVAYTGPLIILTNRLSASASEIFTAALQDYGRAVIVGDESTFGKGTVQTLISIAHFIPSFGGGSDDDAGALKLTIQKFYRIAGGSTQLHGVASDIVIPSQWDIPQLFGESALKGPLPYDVVPAADYDKIADHPLFIDQLKKNSAARVAANPEFAYVIEDLNINKQKLADNKVSLNEKTRRAEDAAKKQREDLRTAARAKLKAPDEKVYDITLDNVDKPDLQLVKNPPKTAAADADSENEDDPDDDPLGAKKPVIDPQKTETLNILNDLIDLSHAAKPVKEDKSAPVAQQVTQ